MVNELSLNQTVQGEHGEFNSLEVEELTLDSLNIGNIYPPTGSTDPIKFYGDVFIDGDLTVDGDTLLDGFVDIKQALTVSRYIDCKALISGTDCRSGRWTNSGTTFVVDYSLDEVGALLDDVAPLTHIITTSDQVLSRNLFIGTWNVPGSTNSSDYTVEINVKAMLEDHESRLTSGGLFQASAESRLKALEDASPTVSIPDNLSTTVQALQARIGALEKVITALKAIHEANKSLYNIPIDW